MVKRKERNWTLVIIASFWMLLSAVVVLVGIFNFQSLGWIAASLMIISGAASIGLAVLAIVKNDSAWLLLDIILPG